ncbi:cupin domain-containing protein [Deinococcus apachensis]|uniref:cupin domain-containing protein n=1 Tax=Deinococcus apachensis TaxID=309886 RepID=UPI0003621DD1|nr:cupin domain-containing protein [Deinococcus apachensis]
MTSRRLMLFTLCSALVPAGLAASNQTGVNADTLKWSAAPPFLPTGAQLVVLDGDPGKAVRVTLRLKFPAGYQIPAHWHPTQEDVTVLAGGLNVGMGDRLDKGASTLLKPGGFTALPARMNHFVWTTEETVVQVHLQGPFQITYADPATDPRR